MQKLRPFTDAQVRLGQQLWFEPRLSRGNTVSCNSCHNLASAGVDNLPTSAGHKGQFGARNSPTALNAPRCWVTSSGTAVPLTWKNRQAARS